MSQNKNLFKYFSYGYFIINTLTIIIILEILIFGFPYISLFLIILLITTYPKFKKYKNTPKQP